MRRDLLINLTAMTPINFTSFLSTLKTVFPNPFDYRKGHATKFRKNDVRGHDVHFQAWPSLRKKKERKKVFHLKSSSSSLTLYFNHLGGHTLRMVISPIEKEALSTYCDFK